MNKVILTGNLARDPEIRYTQSGKAVASFSIAVNRSWRGRTDSSQQQTDFINIIAWEKRAEFCGKYLAKGTRILVEGRLQTRTYEGQDGVKKYVTEVIADEIEFAGGKRQDSGDSGYGNNYSGGYSNDRGPRNSAPNDGDDMIDNGGQKEDIDIPF